MFQSDPYLYQWGDKVRVVFRVIGYNSRQETETPIKEYGGIGPWTFLYMYYFSRTVFAGPGHGTKRTGQRRRDAAIADSSALTNRKREVGAHCDQ
jgi:hypothetical protein